MFFACALGVRRKKRGQTLDVLFPHIYYGLEKDIVKDIVFKSFLTEGFYSKNKSSTPGLLLSDSQIQEILNCSSAPFPERSWMVSFLEKASQEAEYAQKELILYGIKFDSNEQSSTIQSVEEAYFKLQMISQRCVLPNKISLTGLFSILPNLAWTQKGPILPQDVMEERAKSFFSSTPLKIFLLDKFPYLLDYCLPSGVRIADGARVRLGAYLGEGSTVMPAGFVNFNAGSVGPSMIEGRVSAGVLVGENSDIGGGASIMGTLSGGNQLQISIGPGCLLGANAGAGISLGVGCTIAAGLYIYGGMKIALYNSEKKPINIAGEVVAIGENVVKAVELSGRDNLLFLKDSQTGEVGCFPNKKIIQLNEVLHQN